MQTKCLLISMLMILSSTFHAQSQSANAFLSNLISPTAINKSLIPVASGVIDLGSATKLWRNAYFAGDLSVNGLTVGAGAGMSSTSTAVGIGTLHANTTGLQNTAIGTSALYSNISGNANTAIGSGALSINTTGYENTAIGVNELSANTIGYDNTANGFEALFSNTTGTKNSAIGVSALLFNTTGSFNTSFGFWSLVNNTTGFNNTAIGDFANTNGAGYNNSSAFGYSALATAINQVRIGNSTVTSIGGYEGWSNISDGRVKKNIMQNVPGLEFINKLQPVTYNLDLDAADRIVQRPEIKDKNGIVIQPSQEEISARQAKEQIVYTGFVAQDVEKAAQSLNYDFSGVDAPKNDKDLYALRYAEFVVPLVKAVQELSQKNDSKDSTISSLQSAVGSLQAQVDELKTAMSSSTINGTSKLQISDSKLQAASLDQNSPNPFSQQTVISYFLPPATSNAVVKIFSVQGEELESINLSGSGNGEITINGNTLQPGIYVYVLIIDGRTIDTKQMILTK